MLKLDYPLVEDAFDPMDEPCQPHASTSVGVFFFKNLFGDSG